MVQLYSPEAGPIGISNGYSATNPGADLQTGNAMIQIGEAQRQASAKAAQATALNSALTDATLNYSTAINERSAKLVDEKGNPMWSSLSDDVKALGDKARKDALKNVGDYEVAQAFNERFQGLINDRYVESQGTARKQQIDYSTAKLDTDLTKLTQAAIEDGSGNLPRYEQQATSYLNDMLRSGLISQQDYQSRQEKFGLTVRAESWRNQIDSDPSRVLSDLKNNKASSLGINEQIKDHLMNEAEAAVKHQQALADHQRALANKENARIETLKSIQLNNSIEGNVAKAEDIVSTANSMVWANPLDKEIFVAKFTGKLEAQMRSNVKTNDSITGTLAAIKEGTDLSNKTSGEISKAYESIKESMTDPVNKKPPSLQEMIQVAKTIKAPVAVLTKEIENKVLYSNDPKAAVEAVRAFQDLSQSNPIGVSTVNEDTKAVIFKTAALINNTDIAPEVAMQISRETVLKNKTPDVKDTLSAKWNKDFKDPRVDIKAALDMDATFGFGGKEFAPGLEEKLTSVLRDGFMITGDKGAAIEWFKHHVAPIVGVTQFGEDKGFFDNTERLMMFPPEKVYPNVPFESLQNNFRHTVQPDLLPGVDIESVLPMSDDLTRVGNPSYAAVYKSAEGRMLPILDKETSIPIRWMYSGPDARIEEARKNMDNMLKSQSTPEEVQKQLNSATIN